MLSPFTPRYSCNDPVFHPCVSIGITPRICTRITGIIHDRANAQAFFITLISHIINVKLNQIEHYSCSSSSLNLDLRIFVLNMPVAVQDVLPVELIEYILSLCDPLEVAAFAQTSSFFRKIVYETPDQHLWRSLYLSQPFDDPRNAVSPLGTPKSSVDWRTELQRIIRARTIIEFKDVIMCHEEERCTVLETLLNMIDNVSPAPHLFSDQLSRNLLWVAAMLRGAGTFLHHDKWTPTSRELQLRARLHTHFGLTPIDTKPARRV